MHWTSWQQRDSRRIALDGCWESRLQSFDCRGVGVYLRACYHICMSFGKVHDLKSCWRYLALLGERDDPMLRSSGQFRL